MKSTGWYLAALSEMYHLRQRTVHSNTTGTVPQNGGAYYSHIKRPIRTQHAVPMLFRCHAVPLRVQDVSFPLNLHSAAVSDSHLPCHTHAAPMPFFSRPRHSTTIDRRPVSYLPAFGFFRLPREVPRKLLSEAYKSSSQRSIPTTIKSGSSTLQKRRSVKLLDQQFGYFRLPCGFSRRTRHCRSRAGTRHGLFELTARHGMGTAWARNAMRELP